MGEYRFEMDVFDDYEKTGGRFLKPYIDPNYRTFTSDDEAISAMKEFVAGKLEEYRRQGLEGKIYNATIYVRGQMDFISVANHEKM